MSLSKLISNYTTYNNWANHKLVNFLQPLEEKLMYQKVDSSFDTIDQTLQHILLAQKFWLTFIRQQEMENFKWKIQEEKVQEIFKELKQVSMEMKKHFSAFTEEELLIPLHLDQSWAKVTLSRYEYMMHVINHSTYHRGQVITMIRTLGVKENIPNTDYNMFNILSNRRV